MKIPSYRDPIKDRARRLALGHAVEILTTKRHCATCVSRDYVRAVRDHEISGGNPYDAKVAARLDDLTIDKWEQFHAATIGTRRPEELTVCYLCGPEPRNDFDVLIELGVHPHNIWAFEADPDLFSAAIDQTRASEFRMLKIVRGPIDRFFLSTPKRFDIIYLDACGPLPSPSQHTLRMVACALRHHRLASPGVLVTNFAAPVDTTDHARLVAASLYPRDFLEYEHDNRESGAADGVTSYGLDLDEFQAQVALSFDDYYGQYITRQLFDLACLVVPWVRTIEAPQWGQFFSEEPKRVASAAEAMGDLDAADDELAGLAVTDVGHYSMQFALRAQGLIPPAKSSPTKLAKSWLQQIHGLPGLPGGMDASTAMLCHDVLKSVRRSRRFYTEKFASAIKAFSASHRLFQFCDVPTETLAFDLLVCQLAYPLHYVTDAVRRWTYIAKATRMFLDVIVFDEARYIYDWMPLAELLECGVLDDAQQLSYRFALDGLAKNRRWYNMELFHGSAVVDQSEKGFAAKYLRLREEVTPDGVAKRTRIITPHAATP